MDFKSVIVSVGIFMFATENKFCRKCDSKLAMERHSIAQSVAE